MLRRIFIVTLSLCSLAYMSCCYAGETAGSAGLRSIFKTIVTPAKKQPGNWSAMFYAGSTSSDSLAELLKFKSSPAGENLYSAELAYAWAQKNPVMHFFSPLLDQIQFAGNFVLRHDYANSHDQVVPEVDLYLMFRRVNRLWQNYLYTTIAVGEGVSYAFAVPYVENGITGHQSNKFLNFLAFEFTASLPQYPQLQVVLRLHHRSGAYGLYYPKKYNPGSNTLGVGIRYYFK